MQCASCGAPAVRSLRRLRVRSASSRAGSDERESPLRSLLRDASAFGEPERHTEPELQWATQPYAARPADMPPARVDPRDTTVLLFPGQGAHYVGMGRRLLDIPAAKQLYDLASSVVGWDVARVCMEGPAQELTRRCQTATVVTALAALEAARDSRPAAVERVRAAAGFSLGEIAALIFAAALPFDQALKLVEVRAAAMEAASRERAGGMLTLWLAADARLGPALHAARDYAATAQPDPICHVANYLYPSCKVVAGDEEALKYLEREGKQYGVRRTARVQVAGAFHTAAMRAAADAVRAALALCDVRGPALKVYSSVDGRPYASAAHVRTQLPKQVMCPVRWEQTLHAMYARKPGDAFPLTLALGPGAALRATLKQVNAKAWDCSLQIDA